MGIVKNNTFSFAANSKIKLDLVSYLPTFNMCGPNGIFNGLDMNGQIQCSLKNENENKNNDILSFFLY